MTVYVVHRTKGPMVWKKIAFESSLNTVDQFFQQDPKRL
jgi:hypothetical protein